MSAATHTGRVPPSAVRVRWNDVDRYRILTVSALVGLITMGLLAVFGLPPVDLHAPPHYVGVMDPFCGMTRGVRLVARGDLAGALRYNPASPLVPVGGLVLLARHVHGWRTGRWAEISIRWNPALVTVAALVVALLWARQQANVDLLVNG